MKQPSIQDRFLLFLFRSFPPTETIFKEAAGRAQTEYGDEVATPFNRYFGRGSELLRGLDILDLGCGFGGRAVRFIEAGARSVIGVEVEEEKITAARRFAAERGIAEKSQFLVGVGEDLPLPAACVDLVLMNDVMEHVIKPHKVLDEVYRVLRPNGRAAIVFPPYYDVIAGSHLHGYATRLPGLNLLFSTKALKSAATLLLEEQGIDFRRYLREVPSDKLWNQNGLTIRQFLRLLHERPFHIDLLLFLGHRDYRFRGYRGLRKLFSLPFVVAANLPVIREAFCDRVCALLQKESTAT